MGMRYCSGGDWPNDLTAQADRQIVRTRRPTDFISYNRRPQ